MSYLDNTGLQKVFTKLKTLIDKKSDVGHTHISLAAVTTTGTGTVYEANVPGITELTNGVSFIMIPHTASAAVAPTLNVNSLGAKTIRMKNTFSTKNMTQLPSDDFIRPNYPIKMIYDGINWYIDSIFLQDSRNLNNAVPITKGGTGATTVEQAKINLGGLSVVVSDTEPTNDNCNIWIKTS